MAGPKAGSGAAGPSGVFVAWLRGINVGGKNKLPMKDLAAVFEAAGARDVKTYIQSGNVLFRAPIGREGAVSRAVETGILKRFDITSPVVVRSKDALQQVFACNPFLTPGAPGRPPPPSAPSNVVAEGRDPAHLHVAFLASAPPDERIRALDPRRSPGDEFVVAGQDIYLCLPNGVARTKLTNDHFDRTLGTVSTVRNWRTVGALLALADPM